MRIAAVLGGANGGLAELRCLPRVDAVFAVNDAAAEYTGHLDSFVTLHPEKLPAWLERRRSLGLPAPGEVVAHDAEFYDSKEGKPIARAVVAPFVTHFCDYRFPGMNASGSSGLFAAKRALESDPHWGVVLCGVPMDGERTQYAESTFHNDRGSFVEAWKIAMPYLRERVRSMSGQTAEWLGRPEKEWFGIGPDQSMKEGF